MHFYVDFVTWVRFILDELLKGGWLLFVQLKCQAIEDNFYRSIILN